MVATVPPAPSSGFTAAPTAALRRALSAAASPAFVAVVSTANESWARSGVARTSPCPLTTSVRRSPARSCASAKIGTATRSQHASFAIRDPVPSAPRIVKPTPWSVPYPRLPTPGPDLRDERLPRRAIVAGGAVARCVGSPSTRIRSTTGQQSLAGEADPRYTRTRVGLQPGHLGNVG